MRSEWCGSGDRFRQNRRLSDVVVIERGARAMPVAWRRGLRSAIHPAFEKGSADLGVTGEGNRYSDNVHRDDNAASRRSFIDTPGEMRTAMHPGIRPFSLWAGLSRLPEEICKPLETNSRAILISVFRLPSSVFLLPSSYFRLLTSVFLLLGASQSFPSKSGHISQVKYFIIKKPYIENG
jgi:hypothetical protein